MLLPIEISQRVTRVAQAYMVTRDGFNLLAIRFTGEEALAFKLAYMRFLGPIRPIVAIPVCELCARLAASSGQILKVRPRFFKQPAPLRKA